ncbi:MAG: TM2 domain-containing protein [Chloroflexi bacterium]|nr:TM2 domain-containing protein [Chloroflexota bacterium]
MYCRNCGAPVGEKAAVCTSCGMKVGQGVRYCWNCGAETGPAAEICIKCGVRVAAGEIAEQKDWTTALLLSIFLGELGIDRFYLGYTVLGILKLLTAGGCGIWWLIDLILIAMNNLPDAEGRALRKR